MSDLNSKKVLLLDFDGVISPGKYFSEIYSEEFDVDIKTLLPFFESVKDTANVGKADLKELLKKVLTDWQWKGTVDELIEYWMHADSEIDERIVKVAKSLKKSSVNIYLATDQEKYRTKFIWESKGLEDWMDGRFVSYEMGYHKKNSKFFEKVINTLDISPNEVLFFDDSKSKIRAAKEVGIDSYIYTSFDQFKNVLKELGLINR